MLLHALCALFNGVKSVVRSQVQGVFANAPSVCVRWDCAVSFTLPWRARRQAHAAQAPFVAPAAAARSRCPCAGARALAAASPSPTSVATMAAPPPAAPPPPPPAAPGAASAAPPVEPVRLPNCGYSLALNPAGRNAVRLWAMTVGAAHGGGRVMFAWPFFVVGLFGALSRPCGGVARGAAVAPRRRCARRPRGGRVERGRRTAAAAPSLSTDAAV